MKLTRIKKLIAFVPMLIFYVATAQNSSIPYLTKDDKHEFLKVENKHFLMLAGELHNSSTGSLEYMCPIWKRLADKNLNTVIAPITWELFEPSEGNFDYSLVDSMILGARKENLKLVILWFGSWKNGKSSYAPEWVKTDPKRFPLAKDKNGNTFSTLSTFGKHTLNADTNAFVELMKRIKEIDNKDYTVLMVQIENEVGLLDYRASYQGTPNACMREFSKEATKSFKNRVPQGLLTYLEKNEATLHPALKKAWDENGHKTDGSWEEVFGTGVKYDGEEWKNEYSYLTEELFMSWHYARYIGEIARAGKEVYPLPMYVNAWLKQPKLRDPGLYPSGGPQEHVIDVYRAAAPDIDFIAPDIYEVNEFDWFCEEFSKHGNPLFIPETRVDADAASRAFYAFGKYKILGYSPFGIDGGGLLNTVDPEDKSFTKVYGVLNDLNPFFQKYAGTDKMNGLFIDNKKTKDMVDMGDYSVSIERPSYLQAMGLLGTEFNSKQNPEELASGVIIFQLAKNEFLIAGGIGATLIRITKSFSNISNNIGYASIDEVTIEDGEIKTHRLNGDESAFGGPVILAGEAKIFKIRMYDY